MTAGGVSGFTMIEARPLRSFGRRKGKALSARKERLLNEVLPRLRLDLANPPPARLAALFEPPVTDVWLEIGFGSGEHLLWQTEHHPEIGVIGCEPFINGMASLLGAIEDRDKRTIRVHDGDARDVLAWLPDASIGRLFLLFPDPWPKKRQLKRRLVTPEFVCALARVLRKAGEFRFASDDADYAAQVQLLLRESGAFDAVSELSERPADWPETRYERKALREGRKSIYLRLGRA
ncbi:MAG TPA: tRNA (guanine(46)-N(7))-methyltransferase TrmB [Methyloceanibacter sp.]|nr:tRNA (guanine(46)-N(7))-methyltransferase TrmB [Methyloceanibacter sp.]